MRNILSMAFLLIGISMLIFFGMGSTTTLMDSANESINSSNNTALAASFETATNVTVGAFSILSNLPLLIVVIIIIAALFMFVHITR